MKKTRLKLAGSVVRMRDNEIPNRITNYNMEGERRVRRPKIILIDVNGDMRKAGVRHWRKVGEDRDG